MKQKFFKCARCGNIVAMVKESGVPIVCCGETMKEILPCSTEASTEKHIPVYAVTDGTVEVTVGAVEHPMTDEHHIEWISLQTKYGNQRKELSVGQEPKTCFALCDGDEVEAVYAYCNLHGLWRA